MVDKKMQVLDDECHKVAYEVLKSTAGWLENPDNEIYSLLEEHVPSVEIAAKACVMAANILKKASLEIQLVSGVAESKNNISTALEKLQVLANEFDNSGDPTLMKKASVLDEILLTVAADMEAQSNFKKQMQSKIDQIKKNHAAAKNGIVSEATEEKESKPNYKTYEENEASLSTRYCPDHPGVQVFPKGDDIVQCTLDGKIYNYKEGFTLANGNRVPGTCVENQTHLDAHINNPLVVEVSRTSK